MNSQEAFNKTMHRLNYASGIVKNYQLANKTYLLIQQSKPSKAQGDQETKKMREKEHKELKNEQRIEGEEEGRVLEKENHSSSEIKGAAKDAHARELEEFHLASWKSAHFGSTRKAKHLKEVGLKKAEILNPILTNQLTILHNFVSDFTLGRKALRKNEKLIPLFFKELSPSAGLDASFGKTLIQSWEKLTPGKITPAELTTLSGQLNDTIQKLKAAAPEKWLKKAA